MKYQINWLLILFSFSFISAMDEEGNGKEKDETPKVERRMSMSAIESGSPVQRFLNREGSLRKGAKLDLVERKGEGKFVPNALIKARKLLALARQRSQEGGAASTQEGDDDPQGGTPRRRASSLSNTPRDSVCVDGDDDGVAVQEKDD